MATQTRSPTSDEAVSGTWSGSAGTRYTLVDDYPDTTGADILTGGTTAAVITFGYSALTVPAGATGISVQVQYYDGEAANGANNCGGRLKVGGSYFNATTHNPSGTTYTSREDNWATNPKTSAAWTVDDVNGVGVNALQAFGMNSTDSNPTWRFSSIQLQVTYTVDTTISPSAIAASGSVPAPQADVTLTATIEASSSVPSPSLDSTLTPSAISSSGSVTSPAVSDGSGTTLTPSAIDSSGSVPSPTLETTLELTVMSGGSVPQPIVSATVSISAIAGSSSVPSPNLSPTLNPAAISSSTTLPTPTLSDGSGVTIELLAIDSTLTLGVLRTIRWCGYPRLYPGHFNHNRSAYSHKRH